jgi:hypothetical protein
MNRVSSELLVKNLSNGIPLLCRRVSFLKALLPINFLQSLRAADIVIRGGPIFSVSWVDDGGGLMMMAMATWR